MPTPPAKPTPHTPRLAAIATALATLAAPSAAQLPVTGCEVPELAALDALVEQIVTARNIPGVTVAVMKDGVVVYERGFGHRDAARTIPMPPHTMMRVGSVSKPVTAAAVRVLIADGLLSLHDNAFDLGQPYGGILPHQPFPTLGDERLKQVTIDDLLHHTGGWNRQAAGVGDLTYMEIDIADAMNVPSPPGRDNTMRYILGQPLQFTPGAQTRYANIGYLVLGLIVEEVSGMDLMDFLELRVLRPIRIDPAEYILGRSFEADKHPREPYYHLPVYAPNVFDPDGPAVLRPYGSYHHEARVGQGGHVTTARSLLHFLDNHHVNGPLIGARRAALPPGTVQDHGGTTYGSEATAVQRGDGVNFAVTINQWNMGFSSHAAAFYSQLNSFFNTADITWPTQHTETCYNPADINGDGPVDIFDLALLLDALGHPCDACPDCFADLNGDCAVDIFDLMVMFDNWQI